MKKLLSIILSAFMLFTLGACAGNTQNNSVNQTDKPAAEAVKESDEASDKNDTVDGEKALVAYFSNTGNTEGMAEYIAEIIGGDLFEIVPEEPYTDEDLNYNDSSSRSSLEMNDPSSRPAISSVVEDMEQYNTIYIGYPIWWGDAPRIISTFLESYDFSGKNIIPFCTSASSGIGTSAENLQSLTADAEWYDGRRFAASASKNDVEAWIDNLNLIK
ncbi:MAG: flavodoxin [Oscillospiraceae bacterium]|nr:flavodoxin [Oscillospiraceae bacterium]